MSVNKFQTLREAEAVSVAHAFSQAINASPDVYGTTEEAAAAFAGLLSDYNETIAEVGRAETAFRSAVQARRAAKAAMVDELATLAKVAYAVPSISNGDLAQAGLAIHAVPGTITPETVTGLCASPSPLGTVKLTWKRNGNPYGVNFVVEAMVRSGEWQVIDVTKATRITLSGFEPGVPAWLRVISINSGVRSTPSAPVSLYGSSTVGTSLAA